MINGEKRLQSIIYYMNFEKKRFCRARRKLENMNRTRLLESKKIFTSKVVEISTDDFVNKVLQERDSK